MNRSIFVVALPLALIVCLGSCARSTATAPSEPRSSCVSAPQRIGGIAVPNRGLVNAQVGAVVYVELVEAGRYLSWSPHSKPPPAVFPWLTPRSSSTLVLEPVELCRQRGVSTLPVRTFAFRAAHSGVARIGAALAPAWRAAKPSVRGHLRPYSATVVVTGATARRPDGSIDGYVELCGGPAPGRCRVQSMGVCTAAQGCLTSDRVLIRDKHGRQVAQRRLFHARFRLRLPAGTYTVELLADGKRTRGAFMQRRTVTVGARRSAHVRFLFAIP